MNKKGFTLIELLAVIVILTIIALIAVPIVLNIIGDSKNSSVVRSGELYLKAVEQAIMKQNLDEKLIPSRCKIQSDGNIVCNGKKIKVEANGSKPTSGTILLENGKITTVKGMIIDNSKVETDSKNKLVLSANNEKEYTENTLNGADPEYSNKLIPVIYKDNNWVIADTTKEWYSYENQEWANAVVLKEDVTKNVGDTVDVSTEVQGMFVWIPRYE